MLIKGRIKRYKTKNLFSTNTHNTRTERLKRQAFQGLIYEQLLKL